MIIILSSNQIFKTQSTVVERNYIKITNFFVKLKSFPNYRRSSRFVNCTISIFCFTSVTVNLLV